MSLIEVVIVSAVVAFVASLLTHVVMMLFGPRPHAAAPKVIEAMARHYPAALKAAMQGGSPHRDEPYDQDAELAKAGYHKAPF
jgi:hypothetical protein